MSLFASHAAAVPHCVHVAAATLARPSTGASAADQERLEEAQALQKARHAARAPSRRLAAHCCGEAGECRDGVGTSREVVVAPHMKKGVAQSARNAI
jgi:D-tyrosyl-tRNA(Tyr) deacylase